MQTNWITNEFMTDRFDCEFYDFSTIEVIQKVKKLPHKHLKDFVKSKRSEPPIHSSMYSDMKNGVPIIRFANFDDFEYDLNNNVIYLNKKFLAEEKIKDFVLKPNTVVYGLVGDVGHAFIPGKGIPIAITYRRVAQLELEGIDEYYVCTFLNTKYGKKQFDKYTTGVNQKQLRLEDSLEVVIPYSSRSIESYIGNKVRKAEQLREEAKVLKEEAEEILNKAISEEDIMKIFRENDSLTTWVNQEIIQTRRLDADFFKEAYVDFDKYIYKNKDKFTKLNTIAKLSKKRADLKKIGEKFIYLDISSLNEDTGMFEKNEIFTRDAPSRAQKLLCLNDILVSTVRPNRKGIGIVRNGFDQQVASTGFAILQAKANPYFLFLLLRNDIVTEQLIRFTSGGLYPAISEEDLMGIFVPNVDKDTMNQIEEKIKLYFSNLENSKELIFQAKQDIESLIEGTFDESEILEGE